jgi:hypothetical protein
MDDADPLTMMMRLLSSLRYIKSLPGAMSIDLNILSDADGFTKENTDFPAE